MRSIRPLREWPRALSARRLVLLATVASLGVAAAAGNLCDGQRRGEYATSCRVCGSSPEGQTCRRIGARQSGRRRRNDEL